MVVRARTKSFFEFFGSIRNLRFTSWPYFSLGVNRHRRDKVANVGVWRADKSYVFEILSRFRSWAVKDLSSLR
jgi:hypothetical protein